MNRGYFRLWRKIEDSVSWNRGLMYQGLMVNFLRRANWKKSSFQGTDILPGQFAISMTNLASALDVPRSTLQRMVAHLESDDFVKARNVGNRFILFTIINWHTYQQTEESNGRPMGDQRLTDGQPVGTSKEDKNIYISPLTPLTGGSEPPLELAETSQGERTRERDNAMSADCPTGSDNNACGSARKQEPAPKENGKAEGKRKAKRKVKGADLPPYSEWFETCWKKYPNPNGKSPAWRAFRELQQEGQLPEDLQQRIEYRALEDDWQENIKTPGRLRFIPHMSTWLHARGWEDEGCFCEPDPRNTPQDLRRNAIMGKYNFGMPYAGESPEKVLARCDRMNAELEAEGLL